MKIPEAEKNPEEVTNAMVVNFNILVTAYIKFIGRIHIGMTESEMQTIASEIRDRYEIPYFTIDEEKIAANFKKDWKKFPDEKPNEDQNCLVCCGDYEFTLPHKAYYHDGFFRSLETNSAYPLLVTMWMPLPEIPK